MNPVLLLATDYFSQNEYLFIMEHIKKESREVHDTLLQCARDIKRPCILKVDDIQKQGVYYPQGEYAGYAFLKMPDMQAWQAGMAKQNLKYLIGIYERYIDIYGSIMPIDGRKYILNLVKVLNVDLYEIFMNPDASFGANHIRLKSLPASLAAVSYNPIDGLPLIAIDKDFITLSIGQQLFTIAHELAHYILEHLMFVNNIKLPEYTSEGIGRLSLEQDQSLFKKSKRRINEYEADRFAILEFGTKIADAVSLFNKQKDEVVSLSNVLHSSHPDIEKRIEYLVSLEREIGSSRAPFIIDWSRLAQEYKEFGWE